MKVYTKTGDKGTTALIGGRRVSKSHIRINAYGSVDELMAFIGLLYDSIENQSVKLQLLEVQDRLMTCATILAADCADCQIKLPSIIYGDIEWLEQNIDAMQAAIPSLIHFILPGGHPIVSYCHIARTICRRCERLAIEVESAEGGNDMVLIYLNRLSDYLFVLGRFLAKELNISEIHWEPRK